MVDYRVALGDVLSVDYAVENQGETVGEQEIKLLVDSTQEDSDTGVVVDVGVTETGTLQWDTSGATAQEYTVSVESADTSDQFTLEVVDPTNTAFYLVDIDSTNSPILDKQTLDVTATIENVGDQSGTQDITLDIDGNQEDSITGKNLAAGASDTVTLNWTAPSGTTGDKTATVNSADDFDDVTITVEQGSGFEVTIDSTNEPVTEGDTLNVQATIENTGLEQDKQFITLDIDNGVGTVDNTNVTLAPDSAKTVVLEWATQDGDGGTTYTATVSSLDDSATASAEIVADDPAGPFSEVVWSYSGISDARAVAENNDEVMVVGETGDFEILDGGSGAGLESFSLTGGRFNRAQLSDSYAVCYDAQNTNVKFYDREQEQVVGTRSATIGNSFVLAGNIAVYGDSGDDEHEAINITGFTDPDKDVVINTVNSSPEGAAQYSSGRVFLGNNGQPSEIRSLDLSNLFASVGIEGNQINPVGGGLSVIATSGDSVNGTALVDDQGTTTSTISVGGAIKDITGNYLAYRSGSTLAVTTFDESKSGDSGDALFGFSDSIACARDRVYYATDTNDVKMRKLS